MKNMTRPLRSIALTTIAFAAVLAGGAFAQTSPLALRPASPSASAAGATTLQGADRSAALTRANASLNGVNLLQGRFVQIGPDGSRAGGRFYMQRPGKLRFEYDAPATLVIVSDGRVVHMRDRSLRTTDRTPLDSTPLNLVLRDNVDLAREARVTRVARQGDSIFVSARDRRGIADGEITMRFVGPNAELRSWDVIDATGARTQIQLTEVTRPAAIDRRMFRLEDMLENRPGPRR
jgi:outer membrane lipoprotein-sorting protein